MNRYSESQTKSAYRSPVYNVRAVPVEKVVANSYNPVSYTHLTLPTTPYV